MNPPVATFFWRRLDQPGHDSCRLFQFADGWRLSGMAVFREGRKACHLQYEVMADAAFGTRGARVNGYVGTQAVDLKIRAHAGERWEINGVAIDEVDGCIDVDLGFTPATNLLVIRRLALKVGQAADAPAAYLAFPKMELVRLPQRYERTSRNEYAYESPSTGYAGTLRVSSMGAVLHYPGLFESALAD
jgi:hypothetical protein